MFLNINIIPKIGSSLLLYNRVIGDILNGYIIEVFLLAANDTRDIILEQNLEISNQLSGDEEGGIGGSIIVGGHVRLLLPQCLVFEKVADRALKKVVILRIIFTNKKIMRIIMRDNKKYNRYFNLLFIYNNKLFFFYTLSEETSSTIEFTDGVSITDESSSTGEGGEAMLFIMPCIMPDKSGV